MFSSVEDEDKLSACPHVNEARTSTPILSYVISYVGFAHQELGVLSEFRIPSYHIRTELPTYQGARYLASPANCFSFTGIVGILAHWLFLYRPERRRLGPGKST